MKSTKFAKLPGVKTSSRSTQLIQQIATVRKSLEQQQASLVDTYSVPDTWAEWVRTIPIKSGSGITNMEPLKWQSEAADFIMGQKGRKSYSFIKSRQVGASTFSLSIWDYMAITRPMTVLFLHKTYSDAALLGNRNRRFLKNAGVPMVSEGALRQELFNGSELHYRSADPETAGRGLDSVDIVVFEECGFVPLAEVISTISPAQQWCENAISAYISTPNGRVGVGEKFWQLCYGPDGEHEFEQRLQRIREQQEEPFQMLNRDSSISRIIVHWRCIERFANEPDFKARKLREDGLSEEAFAQEFDLDYSMGTDEAIFEYSTVAKAIELYERHEDFSDNEAQPKFTEIYAGVDAATSGADFAAAVALEKIPDGRLRVCWEYRKKKGTSDLHLSRIEQALQPLQPESVLVERNSIGQIWLERLSHSGKLRCEGFVTTQNSKEALIGRLNLALERGILEIPKSSPIVDELLSFRRVNNRKLEATQGCHDDTVIALGLALAASGWNSGERLQVRIKSTTLEEFLS